MTKPGWSALHKDKWTKWNGDWRLKNPNYFTLWRDNRLGVERPTFWLCDICDKPIGFKQIRPDHNHLTGQIRGFVCNHCNAKLGWFEKRRDRIEKYLKVDN